MADGDIAIKDLSEALQISDNAEFVYTQDNGGTNTTFKAPVSQIARKIAESVTYTNLETTAKTLVGAINELSHLGNPILLGTTAPTSSQGADGNIYVQYTEGTGGDPDTVDSIYAKIDGAWCEIETGGGGSGGHTIVDDSGTALTQRTNLQFNGAYSEDNSTDDTTEVNVVREMTKAEFDLLSADEKTGLINITDITGGNDDRFQPVIYSEDEREIGVWADGKPLYEQTFVFSSTLSCASNDWTDTEISSSNIERVVSVSCFSDSGTLFDFVGANRDSSNYIQLFNTRTSAIPVDIVTLRYTKITDTAGSGQWTPQGVPAVHYSEDEQVVGTWIDGSTLYEKTVHVQPTGNVSDYTTFASISGINVVLSTQFFAKRYTNGITYYYTGNGTSSPEAVSLTQYKLGVRVSNGNVQYYVSGYDAEITDIYATLRYTKLST